MGCGGQRGVHDVCGWWRWGENEVVMVMGR